MSLRTLKTFRKYEKHRRTAQKGVCPFCNMEDENIIKRFKYWTIVPNAFPYDKLAEINHIIISNRHIESEKELTEEERDELLEIKTNDLAKEGIYTSFFENFPIQQSIRNHYHIHLIKLLEKFRTMPK